MSLDNWRASGVRAFSRQASSSTNSRSPPRTQTYRSGHPATAGRLPAPAVAEGSSAASTEVIGPLVFRPLMKRPVDPVTEGVGGLVCECLFQIPEDDAHEEVLLPRFRSQAADR